MENKQIKGSSNASRSRFDRASAFFLSKLKESFLGRFFTSYDSINSSYIEKARIKREKSAGRHNTRRKISKIFERSFFVNVTPRLTNFMLRTSTRDYGIVLLTMGIFMSLLYPIRNFVTILSVSFSSFIIGLGLTLCSIPLLFSTKSYATNVLHSRPISLILFKCLGMKTDNIRAAAEQPVRSGTSTSFLIGMLLGIISYFVKPSHILFVFLVLAIGYVILTTPETGIVLLLFTLPFMPISMLIGLTIYVDICYLIKYTIGKRTFKFEFFDIFILVALIMVIYGYAVSMNYTESLVPTLISSSLVLCYFAVSNLIRSKEWYRRCIVSLSLSGAIASVIGIIQFIFSKVNITWQGITIFATAKERITSTFYDPDVFAIYLCTVIPFMLLLMFSASMLYQKFLGFLAFSTAATCIFMSYSKPAIIALVVELLLFLIIYNRNFIYLTLVTLISIPILYYTLPVNMLQQISHFINKAELLPAEREILRRATAEIFISRPFGIGVGEHNLNEICASLGINIENSEDLGSLYFQFLASYGIFGVLCAIALLVVFTQMTLSFCAKAKNRHRRINGTAGFVSVIGILVSGGFAFSLKSSELVFMLFAVIALCFSYFKLEREIDKPVSTYVDITSANADIEISDEFTRNTTPKRKYVHSPKKKKTKKVRSPLEDLMYSNEFIRIVDDNKEKPSNDE